ncbi:MAG: phosphate signaling complex protein PhoU [Candidatus Thermoplasmatota archaeon]|nr:phosphate signaling complex protein PhoU [Candidatus Thermoplasmatota archaeon]MBU1941293.1 phosphate signaling complex protein PhoU [Candidatus Thermoplasmatota archaeon]
MTEKFHKELNTLKKDVIKMGHLSTEMLKKSVEALKKQDIELAKWVDSKKTSIATMDHLIEAKAFQLLTLHQPMAKDLRQIACSLKMITYLARIGRYGKDIAKITIELSDKPHIKKLVSIPHMAEMVCSLIDDALLAFEKETIEPLKDFSERDDDIDQLRYAIFRECLTYMMEDQKVINQCAQYMMVSRYLERCGDHACKMAEKIHYMVTGKHIEIDVKSNQ